MEKKSSSVKRMMNDIEYRSLADFHYAYFVLSCACRHYGAADPFVKKAFAELDDTMNHFMLAIGFEHKEENNG